MRDIEIAGEMGWYKYSKKHQWELQKGSFPVTMEYDQLREYLGGVIVLNSNEEFTVYRNKDYDKSIASYKYVVDLGIFAEHNVLVVCDNFIDLHGLINEVCNLRNMDLVDSLEKIENTIHNIMVELKNIKKEIVDFKEENDNELNNIDSTIETGISKVIKNMDNITAFTGLSI